MNRTINILSTSRTAVILLLATLLNTTAAQTAGAQDLSALSVYTEVPTVTSGQSSNWNADMENGENYNKLVDGNIAQAIARIKAVACPQNARRLGLNTPCGLQGKCDAANCEKGMCNVTSIIERPVGGHKITIVLVDEEAGY